MKEIIDKLGLIKIKKFCSMEDKSQGKSEEIFAKDVSDKGLI